MESTLAYGSAIVSWLTLFGFAFLADLVFGTRALFGRLPGPDDLFAFLAGNLETRLNRPQRSARERRVRGFVLVLLLLPPLVGVGLLLNRFAAGGSIGFGLTALLLMLLIRQRRGWDRVLEDAKASAQEKKPESRYDAARRGAERLVFTFAETVVAGLVLFALGGFAALLPFQFTVALLTAGAPKGASAPEGPFFTAARLIYWLLSLPAALIAALALAASPLVLPGASPRAGRGLRVAFKGRLPLRVLPLSVTAHALGLAFEGGPADKTRWIGPKDGRARIEALDIAAAGRMVLVAEGMILLILLMTTSFFLAGA